MENRKKVLQGIDNFKKLIDNNGYYVDKTLLIKELIDVPSQVVLITRPRRFGKTLNMSMLKYFFELPECRRQDLEEEDASYLFSDLEIGRHGEKYIKEMGKYPVIYLTLKNAKQNTYEETLINLKKIIAAEYYRHSYLLNEKVLSEKEATVYKDIINLEAATTDYTDVILNLSQYLKRYFKVNSMVIIDEYDTPIQSGYIHGYFTDVLEFTKSMLVKGFKDNNALKQGVLTGIMKVAQESIFSDFNNPMVCTVLSERYKDKFGFTELEVEKMAEYLGLEGDLPSIKKWYNGYIFGNDTVIYNPWSIVKYMSMPEDGLKPYWINTSDNRVIKEVMQLDRLEGKQVVEKLIRGEEVLKVIEENVVYQSIKNNPNAAWSFLLHAGYLKAYDRKQNEGEYKFEYKIEIPNLEVKTIYKDMILNYFKEDAKVSDHIEVLMKALMNKDREVFEILLQELYLKQVSYDDVKTKSIEQIGTTEQGKRYENFHHGFMLGLFMLISSDYSVESNREYGLGRPDIVILPKDKTKPTYIFEFKWDSTKGSKSLEVLAEIAILQIRQQKYKEGLELQGYTDIECMGVGFKGKELRIKHD